MPAVITTADPFFPMYLQGMLNPNAKEVRAACEKAGRPYAMRPVPFEALVQWHRDCLIRHPPGAGQPGDAAEVGASLAEALAAGAP